MTTDITYWKGYFESAENDMMKDNFDMIKSHIRKLKAENMSEQTLCNHYQALTQFAKWCKKPFTALTEEDILDYSDYLDNQTYAPRFTVNKPKKGSTKKYSSGTKYVKLATVKSFLKNINKEATAAIKAKPSYNKKLPEDLLTREEVEALLDNCPNSRDRALIATMYESGARRGELFSIKIKNVEFDENGTVITIPAGKTGARRIRVVFATEHLRAWMHDHPCKSDREHILFCSLVDPHNRLTDAGLRDQLTKIARKAGISKRVNPHSFRHARATHLAEHLTEQQLKKYLGWTEGSDMASIYVHLSGKDIDKAILKLNGIEPDETEEETVLKTMKCPRCKAIQDARNKQCSNCWLVFESNAEESVKDEIQTMREEIEALKAVIRSEFQPLKGKPPEERIRGISTGKKGKGEWYKMEIIPDDTIIPDHEKLKNDQEYKKRYEQANK